MDTQIIEFNRPNKGVPWGFSIQGGKEFGCPLSVLRVTSGSIADRFGITVGDSLIKINTLPTDAMTHQQAILQIQNLNIILELKKARGSMTFPPPPGALDDSNSSCQISSFTGDMPPPPPEFVLSNSQSSFPPPPLPFLKELQSNTVEKPKNISVPLKRFDNLENNKLKTFVNTVPDSQKFEERRYIPTKELDKIENNYKEIPPINNDARNVDSFPQRKSEGINQPMSSSSLGQFIHNRSNDPSRDSKDLIIQQTNQNKSSAICFVCKEHIKGAYIEANQKIYCNNHFCCSFCGQSITSGQFIETKEGALFCMDDYKNNVAPKCSKCNNPIVDQKVTALDTCWHAHCFVCDHCKKPIGSGHFLSVEDRGTMLVYCEKDYKEHYQIKCSACGFAIEGDEKYVLVNGKNMHVTCFKR